MRTCVTACDRTRRPPPLRLYIGSFIKALLRLYKGSGPHEADGGASGVLLVKLAIETGTWRQSLSVKCPLSSLV